MRGKAVIIRLLAVCLLCAAFTPAVQADTLSWLYGGPIMASNVDYSVAGQLTITADGTLYTIPTYAGPNPTQAIFRLSPTLVVWDASAVNLDPDSTYTYVGCYQFLGASPYNLCPYPNDTWGPWGYTTAMLYGSVYGFSPTDVGPWSYTETWTSIGGADQGASITATQYFSVEPVPEPGSLMLLGTGLIGAAGAIRRKLFS